MSLTYLWQNRIKPPLFSLIWFKQWLKRIFHIFKLLSILNHRFFLEIKGIKIGDLSLIANKCKIGGSLKNISIGNCSFIGEAHIATHANVNIGSYVVINDGVTILTASHAVDDSKWGQFAKPIIIQDYAWIATNAILLPGVNIGKGAIVGAGAVITKDIPDYGIAVGNPAKLLDKQREKNLNYNPVQLIACYEAWLGKPK